MSDDSRIFWVSNEDDSDPGPASKDEKTAQRACYIAGGAYLVFGMLPVGLGLIARVLLPGQETAILPALASAFLAPLPAVLFSVVLLSAVFSTIDSAIRRTTITDR